ncbi:MAG: TIGR01777 family oxidoreductase [Bacteriovoracia bacterium]
MKRIVVTGGTGFVGEKLCLELFRLGYSLTLLTRDPKRGSEKIALPYQFVKWDGASPLPDEIMEGAHAVIHLAGESVAAHRWDEATKQAIHDSRSVSTARLAEAIDRTKVKPKVLLGASATGYYGDRNDELLTESSQPGTDFLATVCLDWEKAYACSAERIVILRTGVVWGLNGGALEKMLPPFRFGVGGKIGSGRQWISWIHLEDLVQLYVFALENEKVRGPLNAVAPNPVTNSELTKVLAKILHRPALFPVPAFVLKLALGEMGVVVLGSQRALPDAAQKLGFTFRFPALPAALADILAPLGKIGGYVFEAAIWLPQEREKVFPFFAAAKNLETITPPWLRFRIQKMSTAAIEEGSLIDYKLLIKGLPVRWRTRIEKWQPQEYFVDRQLKGPYRDWHHTHRFEKVAGGTLMTDRVVYQLPFGVLGDLGHALLVKNDVRTIFRFRKSAIAKMTFS